MTWREGLAPSQQKPFKCARGGVALHTHPINENPAPVVVVSHSSWFTPNSALPAAFELRIIVVVVASAKSGAP